MTFYWSACIKPVNWVVMYMCVMGIDFATDSTIFLLGFRTVFAKAKLSNPMPCN